jgi:hypothetical protein
VNVLIVMVDFIMVLFMIFLFGCSCCPKDCLVYSIEVVSRSACK